jgi:RNA-splicing ligase RtcB
MLFVRPHVALMPDAHSGKGSAVGTVIPTLDAVIPAAIGVEVRNRVWLFLHSGTRGVGNKIAQKLIKFAQQLCKRWWIALPNGDLA